MTQSMEATNAWKHRSEELEKALEEAKKTPAAAPCQKEPATLNGGHSSVAVGFKLCGLSVVSWLEIIALRNSEAL